MGEKRKRVKHDTSLKERLTTFASDARKRASILPPGFERQDLLKRARQADTTAHLEDWINSPGLRPPE